MTVSLCIIAYNEEKALPGLFDDILRQTFPKDKTQIVFVDSLSDDGTRALFECFRSEHSGEYYDICVLDNPDRCQAAGWNTAIKSAACDIIIRVDAHASIPAGFIEKNEELIASGEDVCGGSRPCNILEPTPLRKMLLCAESSMFGSSVAGYRRKTEKKKYVDSLFHGAYRREVFGKVGGFNIDLGRTEDNELHYRIRRNGYRICQSEDIISYQNIRPGLGKMLSQKFANGKWIGLTCGVCPGCLSVFHFVPFAFVAAMILSLAAGIVGAAASVPLLWLPLTALMSAYLAADIIMSVAAAAAEKERSAWLLLLPVVFFLLHTAYGAGTITGLVGLPLWKSRLTGRAQREIEEVRIKVNELTKKTEVEN